MLERHMTIICILATFFGILFSVMINNSFSPNSTAKATRAEFIR